MAACADSATLELREWQLSIDDRHPAEPVILPTHLDDGRVPDRRLHYRLRTAIAVPTAWQAEPLQLIVPDLAAVVQLNVDGVAATDLNASDKGYRRRGPHAWAIPEHAARDGTLELELAVEHTWTQSAWWGTVPRLLPAGAHDGAATRVYVFNLLASCAALVALLQVALASLTI